MTLWAAFAGEAQRAGALWVAGFCGACAAALALTHGRALRPRAALFFLSLWAVLIPAAALVARVNPAGASQLETALRVCGALACALWLCAAVFYAALPRLRVSLPRIVQDVAIAAVAGLTVLTAAREAGVNLSGLIATSAVLTAVIGFSLQDTLGNLMGGLFLQLDNSIEVGDQIKVGDLSGRVMEIRWRYTAVETANGDTAIVPNSTLMKGQVLVQGRGAGGVRRQRRLITFNVDFRYAPPDVMDAVRSALTGRAIPNVALAPAPSVVLSDLGDSTARYTVRYWLTDLDADQTTDSLVRGYVYFALKRAGIPLSMPAQAVFVTQESEQRKQSKTRADEAERLAALAQVDLFSALSDAERQRLARSLHLAPFARGEVVTRQGAEAHWLYLLVEGRVSVRLRADDGSERELAQLSAGQYFGEMSLMTGKPRSTTVVALTDVRSYRLDKVAFQDIVADRHDLADHVAATLASRRAELLAAREGLDAEAAARRLEQDRRDLLRGIKAFFGLPSSRGVSKQGS